MKKRLFFIIFVGMLIMLFVNSEWIGRLMYPIHYRNDIRVSASNYDIDPHLVAAIIRSETNYKTGIESSKGALGIMQIMPDTAMWIADQAGFTDITAEKVHHRADVGIEMGSWYIRSLLQQYEGNPVAAVAAYNAGPGNVNRWLAERIWDGRLSTVKQIPYGETRHYVQRVNFYYNKYKELYPSF